MTTITAPSAPGVERQQKYVAEQTASGSDDGTLIVGSAFVNGIRDLGYQNSAKAIDEVVDNSLQAGATNVHVLFGFEGKNEKKPTAYAVIDDGHGMIPEMLVYAAKWGGTDRENDRKGFGRYGYGLPSSCVSQGKRFTVYSIVQGGEMHSVYVDLDEIQAGKHTGENGRILAPKPIKAELPSWLKKYVDEKFGGLTHGTVVVVDKLDRLTWSTREGLRKHLLEHIGLIYRNSLLNASIVVDGVEVQPIDPLFLTPGARYYAEDDERARPYGEKLFIPIKDNNGTTHMVKVRAAYLPVRFGFINKNTTKKTAMNRRMPIMGDHEGLIILRMGRQMDVINRHPWGRDEDSNGEADVSEGRRMSTWRLTDRYWQIELDFPADLDEQFSVTTSKQTVRPNERVWAALADNGIPAMIREIKKIYDEENATIKAAEETDKEEKRPSEVAMENAQRFEGTRPTPEQIEMSERRESHVEEEARRRSTQTGVPFEQVKAVLEAEIANRPFQIIEESAPGAPFYRPEPFGGQRRVYLNTTHPFYTDLYAGPKSTAETRAALEVLLFVLAGEEVDALGTRLEFYERERSRWSDKLRTALRELSKVMPDGEKTEGEHG